MTWLLIFTLLGAIATCVLSAVSAYLWTRIWD